MRILLFGSTGMLGQYLLKVLEKERGNKNVFCVNRSSFDIENDNWSKLSYIINCNLNENDIIINCAGIIPQRESFINLRTYLRVNTVFPHKLNEIASTNYLQKNKTNETSQEKCN